MLNINDRAFTHTHTHTHRHTHTHTHTHIYIYIYIYHIILYCSVCNPGFHAFSNRRIEWRFKKKTISMINFCCCSRVHKHTREQQHIQYTNILIFSNTHKLAHIHTNNPHFSHSTHTHDRVTHWHTYNIIWYIYIYHIILYCSVCNPGFHAFSNRMLKKKRLYVLEKWGLFVCMCA